MNDLTAIRKVYEIVKKHCYECDKDCDGCKYGIAREVICEEERILTGEAKDIRELAR